jgi:hypothetical protein
MNKKVGLESDPNLVIGSDIMASYNGHRQAFTSDLYAQATVYVPLR